jgi:hypothetical protein
MCEPQTNRGADVDALGSRVRHVAATAANRDDRRRGFALLLALRAVQEKAEKYHSHPSGWIEQSLARLELLHEPRSPHVPAGA